MVIVAMKLPAFLISVQRDIGGIDIEDQFVRRGVVAGDELLDQHSMQCAGIGLCGGILQTTKGWRRAQLACDPYRSLHQGIAPQRAVIVEIFIATAQRIQSLRHQCAHVVRDPIGIAGIAQHGRHSPAQADALIHSPQQHQAAI